MEDFFNKLSWELLILACLTIGLAPYMPQPHILEKLRMLMKGTLVRPIDWFDLVLHATPWALLILKGLFTLKGK